MASIRKRTTRHGVRYGVRYRTLEGEQREETFRTRREADQRVHAIETDKLRGGWLDPRRASRPFGEIAEEWFASNPAKRSSTLARDRSALNRRVLPTLARVPVGSVTPRALQALVNEWSRAGGGSLTVRRNYGMVRAIFNYAVEGDIVARSPCRGIKLPPVESKARHVVTADELRGLADELGPDYAPMAYLGALLGLRWGEVAGLRVGRVDFLAGTVEVAEQVIRGEHGRVEFGPPKSQAGRRVLATPGELLEMLAALLARRGLTGADADALVFADPRGKPWNYPWWRRSVWLPAVEAAELEGLTFHDLLRAAATMLVQERVDLDTATRRLGHSDPRLTLAIYSQPTEEADRAAAQRVAARFLGGPWEGRGIERGG